MRYLIAVALVLSTNGCDLQDIREDMVRFDQAFIPLWAHAQEGNVQKAKAAVFFLEFQWQQLRVKYQFAAEDDEWQETFRRVNDWLGDVYYAVDANRMDLALNQLEHVRYELQQLRRQYHIDYFLDHLYDFQEEVAVLTEASNDEMLCMLEWPEFEELAVSALNHWRRIMIHPFDAAFYGLDAEEERLYQAYRVEMEEVLINFLDVVESADREAIATESFHLEAAFMPLLRLFGDFQSSQTHFASN